MKEWHFINPRTQHAEYRFRIRYSGKFCSELERVSKEGKLLRSQLNLTMQEADSLRMLLTEQGFSFIEAR